MTALMAHISGKFQIIAFATSGKGSTAIVPFSDEEGASVVVERWEQSNPTPRQLWDFEAWIDAGGVPRGVLIRHAATNRYIRADYGALYGGGVQLVSKANIDEHCGWSFGSTTGVPARGPILTYASAVTRHWVGLDLKGSEWGVGSQVITYEYTGAVNQLWGPLWRQE